MAHDQKQATPAYVSYKSFQNNIRGLAHDGQLPSHVDSSVLQSMSGSTRNQFMTALRFFGLLHPDGVPTEQLRALATSNDAEWKATLRPLIENRYHEQLGVLADGTVNKLRDSFASEFNGAAIITPAMRFLVAAAEDVGLSVSGHIKRSGIKGQRRSGTPRKKSGAAAQSTADDATVAAGESDPFTLALLEKFPAFDPSWESGQQKAWFDAYKQLLEMRNQ